MKILDIPQSGKRGVTVSQGGHYGQISRALVIPANPRSASQLAIRQHLASIAANWRTLTEEQRNAWSSMAKSRNTKSRLGQKGSMIGLQLFVQINANLMLIGQPRVTDPPVLPAFPDLVPTGLVITNTAGAIALKLVAATDVNDYTLFRASPPLSQGRSKCSDFRYLGLVPTPAQGFADVTSLYTAKFGVPPVKSKVFVQCNQNLSGFEDIPHEWSAIVPASV